MEKSFAAPEELEMIASLEPVVSLTTVAVKPRLSLLIVAARSLSVSPLVFPRPVAIVVVVPLAEVMVSDEVGKVAVGLDAISEYQDPVEARLLITTECTPAAVPVAAVAERSLLSEEVTVRAARGPVKVFRFSMSVARASVAV